MRPEIPNQLDIAVRATAAIARAFPSRECSLRLRNYEGATEARITIGPEPPEQPQAYNPEHRGSVTAEQFEAIWNDREGEGGDGDEL